MPVGSTAKTKVYLMKLNCKSYVFVNPVESMQATLSASELNYIVPYAYGALYAYGMPIRVWDRENAHTRTGYPIRVWVVPYAYGLSHTRMGQNTRTGCNIDINQLSFPNEEDAATLLS